jgi:hypothetical protein
MDGVLMEIPDIDRTCTISDNTNQTNEPILKLFQLRNDESKVATGVFHHKESAVSTVL